MLPSRANLQAPVIQGVPAMTPSAPSAPTGDRLTALPVYQAARFELLPSPPKSVPVHPASISGRTTAKPVIEDEGWRPVNE